LRGPWCGDRSHLLLHELATSSVCGWWKIYSLGVYSWNIENDCLRVFGVLNLLLVANYGVDCLLVTWLHLDLEYLILRITRVRSRLHFVTRYTPGRSPHCCRGACSHHF
jgi:hypothetical protein